MAFTAARVAVLVDGCYWHGCPVHYVEPKSNVEYWSNKIARNVARDAATTATLADAGWLVLRFWEHESASAVADAVERAVLQCRRRQSEASRLAPGQRA